MGKKAANKNKQRVYKTPRRKFDFCLNINRPVDYQLSEDIKRMKTQREYTQNIRDGLRLIQDLNAGRMDVLFELYPWVKERIQPSVLASDQFAILMNQVAVLNDRLQDVPVQPLDRAVMPQLQFDDADTVIVNDPDAGTRARENFASSMGNLFDDDDPFAD